MTTDLDTTTSGTTPGTVIQSRPGRGYIRRDDLCAESRRIVDEIVARSRPKRDLMAIAERPEWARRAEVHDDTIVYTV